MLLSEELEGALGSEGGRLGAEEDGRLDGGFGRTEETGGRADDTGGTDGAEAGGSQGSPCEGVPSL